MVSPRSAIASGFVLVVVCLHSLVAKNGQADEKDHEFFESQVRPILVDKCSSCHSTDEASGGLRVDSVESLKLGGDTAPAIVPGNAGESLLLKAVRREGELAMPPETSLTKREIESLEAWIEEGAPWPDDVGEPRSPQRKHWAFQPPSKPELPRTSNSQWVQTPVDAFVLSKLDELGWAPSPAASRRELIRRVYYTLTGLPPTFEEVQAFANDPHENSYTALVDRMLASVHYGEHWARHWLDVARYSDTKGYVYAREERHWVHAWNYRDWVVRALNENMPYDRFLRLQLAADQVKDRRASDMAAMGFLTIGRRFLGVRRDIIDDRIDVVCRGMMGLTVSCARCHNHKFDPITSADYYALYGVFESSAEQLVALSDSPDSAFADGVKEREEALNSKHHEFSKEWAQRIRTQLADYLFAQVELDKYPPSGFDQIFQKTDILPSFVWQWERYLHRLNLKQDAIFRAWHEYYAAFGDSFEDDAVTVTNRLKALSQAELHPQIAAKFETPPKSFREVCDRYGQVFAEVERVWNTRTETRQQQGLPAETCIDDPLLEPLWKVLYGESSPCLVPSRPLVDTDQFFDTDSCTALWKLQAELDRWILNSNDDVGYSVAMKDQVSAMDPRVFRRGDPTKPGRDVKRQFLSLLRTDNDGPFLVGSGRMELADAIVAPTNPLTARVFVNRVWAHHFGTELVATPSDFGTRASLPSHPKLLDWLAVDFVESGWNLKELHRKILLSSTFQQSSRVAAESALESQARRSDPENRYLRRMNGRRQSFEEMRDSMLSASGKLDPKTGGKPQDLFSSSYPVRRTLYGEIDRQYLPGTLRVFDFASPDLHVAKRVETTVPQQALFFLNHPMMLQYARATASLCESDSLEESVINAFRRVLQRDPSSLELRESSDWIQSTGALGQDEIESPGTKDWTYGFGTVVEDKGTVSGFTQLPHFSGEGWQGSSKYPDQALGWVQITAAGGHPGNDRKHASIRRWTAPRDLVISIQSQLSHEPAVGDGVRAFVIHSTAGILHSTKIHQDRQDRSLAMIDMKQGDTIDFLVDIDQVLNSDQYLWRVLIEAQPPSRSRGQSGKNGIQQVSKWDSSIGFTQNLVARLTPLEQFVQVLLSSNEFLFVD